MGVKYRTHVAFTGWQDKEFKDGEVAGTLGESKAIEAIEINLDSYDGIGVTYQAHVQDIGWQDPVVNGQIAGTVGASKRIEAIIIDLFGEKKDQYDIIYRCHVQDLGWLNWTKNGQVSGTVGGGKRLEAIQIYFAPKDTVFFDVNQLDTSKDLTPVTPPPVPSESEDSKRARIVAIAQSYIGYVGDDYSIFGDRHGDPYGDWCAYFDWSVYEDAGLADLIPHTGYCPDAVDWFLEHKTASFYSRGRYTPKAGDLIYFDWDNNRVPNHTGLVEGSDGSTVCTIEGNTGSPNQVKRKYWNINDSMILGYGVPDFSL